MFMNKLIEQQTKLERSRMFSNAVAIITDTLSSRRNQSNSYHSHSVICRKVGEHLGQLIGPCIFCL